MFSADCFKIINAVIILLQNDFTIFEIVQIIENRDDNFF